MGSRALLSHEEDGVCRSLPPSHVSPHLVYPPQRLLTVRTGKPGNLETNLNNFRESNRHDQIDETPSLAFCFKNSIVSQFRRYRRQISTRVSKIYDSNKDLLHFEVLMLVVTILKPWESYKRIFDLPPVLFKNIPLWALEVSRYLQIEKLCYAVETIFFGILLQCRSVNGVQTST